MATRNILELRECIYNQFHGSSAGPAHFFLSANADAYAAYYTSMYLIQDTGEAIQTHWENGFSTQPMEAYLEFWGAMQALVIQQDAISELHKAVIGKKPTIPTTTSWIAIRDFRNLCAGHPANKSIGLPAPKRSFMGRHFGTHDAIKYEQWDAHAQKTTHPNASPFLLAA